MAKTRDNKPGTKGARGGEKITFKVKANLRDLAAGDERPTVRAYLFSASGQLVDSKPLSAAGTATFTTDAGSGDERKFRVAVGPETLQLKRLADFGAEFAERRASLGETVSVSLDILRDRWHCWYGVLYFVQGTVRKRITVGDSTILRPICDADVEIYEVDIRHCLLTLPEHLLEQVRDGLIREIEPPGPDPVIRRLPELEVTPRPPGPRPQPMAADGAPEVAAESRARFASSAGLRLSPTLLRSAGTEQLRRLLVDNLTLIKPLLCIYLGYPFCYHTQLLKTVKTDHDGRFATIIGFLCPVEEPDLYFQVKQEINGSPKTIYAPKPIPCHTWWNYVSGTEVPIQVTDPDAISCRDEPVPDADGCYVMPLGVGFDGWHQVLNAHGKSPLVTDRGLYDGSDPYGTALDFTMQFHDSLQAKGVYFYRWSYRREGTSGWTEISTPIVHRYLTKVGSKFKIKTFDLGPFPVGTESNLFRIPNPNLDWVVIRASDRTFARWVTATEVENVWTPLVADGRYELKLQLFDAAGNAVSPGAATWRYFLPSGPESAGEIPVDDSLTLAHADGSLRLRLHVNNQDTVADVKSIALSGEAITDCQFLEYTNPEQWVTITFDANHPHSTPQDFLASYSMSVRRGASGTPVGATSGTSSVTDGTYSIKVKDLLRAVYWQGQNRGPFSRCAFAVNLHTYPRTRNGYSRIRRYEAHDVGAFAVVPKPAP